MCVAHIRHQSRVALTAEKPQTHICAVVTLYILESNMNAWVLVIAMSAPSGDFIDKRTVEFKTRKDCEAVRAQLPVLNSPYGVKHEGVCVTMDHWTGKKKDKGVAFD